MCRAKKSERGRRGIPLPNPLKIKNPPRGGFLIFVASCGVSIRIETSYKNIVVFDSLFLWTYGESDPDLVHAMDAFYR